MSKFYKEKFELNSRILLEEKWILLTSLLNEKKESHYLPFDEEKNIHCFFSIDEEGTRKIYLPFDSSEKFKSDKKSQSIQVALSKNDFFGETNQYIEIICKNPDNSQFIFNKFNALVSMIFVKIKFEEKNNYIAVTETIQEWRDFFRNEKKKYLSTEEIRGLIGELHFLKSLLAKNINAYESWHGPESERHDFRQNNISIEIKTSGSKNKHCTISSVDQLETPEDAKLFCQYYQLEKDDQGYSIPQLIKEIEELGISKIDLERKLNDLNYNFEDDNYYTDSSRKFRILSDAFYEVNDSFPRITKNSFQNKKIPRNIIKIVYQIDLSETLEIVFEEKNKILDLYSKS